MNGPHGLNTSSPKLSVLTISNVTENSKKTTWKRNAAEISDLTSEATTIETCYLRSGKWTNEEEIYARELIVRFQVGSLQDCPEGCSLRTYLSNKLKCAPMRISKKFAGLCIGKVSYFFLNQS